VERLTPRLRIRSFRAEDLDAYAALVADAEVMRYLGGPQTRAEAAAYLDDVLARDAATGIARYAVEQRDDGGFLGFCGFRCQLDGTDFGWRYARMSWGRGYGTEAALEVLDHGVSVLGLCDIFAGCALENVGSLRIIERLGLPWRRYGDHDGRPDVRYAQQSPGPGAERVADASAP